MYVDDEDFEWLRSAERTVTLTAAQAATLKRGHRYLSHDLAQNDPMAMPLPAGLRAPQPGDQNKRPFEDEITLIYRRAPIRERIEIRNAWPDFTAHFDEIDRSTNYGQHQRRTGSEA